MGREGAWAVAWSIADISRQKNASRSLQPGIVQELAEHFLCRKILVGDVVGRLAVQRVVPVNFLGALNCLLERRETIDPSSSRQKSADAGLLHQHRPSSGQIAGATVAEPAALRLDIPWLSHAKLCPRVLNVATVGGEITGDAVGVNDAPTLLRQQFPVLGIASE